MFEGQKEDDLRRLRVAVRQWKVAPRGWRRLFIDPRDYVFPHPNGVPRREVIRQINAALAALPEQK